MHVKNLCVRFICMNYNDIVVAVHGRRAVYGMTDVAISNLFWTFCNKFKK